MYNKHFSNNADDKNKKDQTMRISLPVKEIVLTAIANKGTEQVRKEAQKIAEDCFATKSSVLNWVRKVEQGKVVIN